MNTIRCPHCGRKLAEFNLRGSLVLKTKCPKCGKLVEITMKGE